ncbi:decapping endonuclease targeting mRNA [Orbilia brochopaga]|uniref:Decapping nuclease n=1 Tax=Orbilia brochopaga TaxID=3140254 RepID=A0AAV9UVN5_9PEZI
MQSFSTADYATRFAGKSAMIKRPREITYFSYDDNHELRHDDSSLRYYYTPDLHTDLSGGYNSFIKHDDSVDEHLDSLLEAIIELEKKENKCVTEGVHFVTWRGMVTKLMTVPYMEDGFEMNAVFHNGTIYIEENNQYKQATRGFQDERGARMSYWGYKFETLSTLSKPWAEASREEIENRDKEVVNNKAQYCSIVKTGFGSCSLIIAGEVDAIWDCKPMNTSNPINYVELKTSRAIQSQSQQFNFEKKLQRFWAQSFLLGVPKLIIGFRTDNGILTSVDIRDTQSIPSKMKKVHMAQGLGPPPWDGNVAINFTTAFLEWLKSVLAGQSGLWRIRYKQRGREIEVFQVQESGYAGVLTDRFLAWRTELQERVVSQAAAATATAVTAAD